MITKKLLAGSAIALIPSMAMAADLPARAPAAAPVFASAASWGGFYVGANAGLVWDQYSNPDHCQMYDGAVYDVDYCTAYQGTTWGYGGVTSGSTMGALVGLTAGYNVQSGNMVFGVEADIGAVFGGKYDTQSEFMRGSAQTRALGTIRGRLGIANANTLFYVTAGMAFVNRTLGTALSDYECSDYVGKCGTKTKWTIAPVAGLGIEHQLGGGWSAKVEGLYVFGKSQSVTNYYENDTTDYGKRFSTKASSAIVRFGVNYRFGGASPVVARY